MAIPLLADFKNMYQGTCYLLSVATEHEHTGSMRRGNTGRATTAKPGLGALDERSAAERDVLAAGTRLGFLSSRSFAKSARPTFRPLSG